MNESRTPEAIVDADLAHGMEARSTEYRAGMIDVLMFRMRRVQIQCPHKPGTAAFDAYFAGNERGHRLWRTLQAKAANAASAAREACHA